MAGLRADRLLLASIQTLGAAATTISQMRWSGIRHQGNSHLTRCAERIGYLMGWLEGLIDREGEGFFGRVVSVQDIFLTCHLRFIANRPLDLDARLDAHPKIGALVDMLEDRASFRNNPVRWWEPGIIGYEADGTSVRATNSGWCSPQIRPERRMYMGQKIPGLSGPLLLLSETRQGFARKRDRWRAVLGIDENSYVIEIARC